LVSSDVKTLRDNVRVFGDKCRSIIHVLKRDLVFFQGFMDILQTLLNDPHMKPHKLADLAGPIFGTDKGLNWTSSPAIGINATRCMSPFLPRQEIKDQFIDMSQWQKDAFIQFSNIDIHDLFELFTISVGEGIQILDWLAVFCPMPEKMIDQVLLVKSHEFLKTIEEGLAFP
jgi:hypothetical protein